MSAIRAPVVRAITECFGCEADDIADDTVAADVVGWDSLGHTVLMMRIERLLGFKIPEIVAANAKDVGDLIAKLEHLQNREA
ncbi:MAG: hypothetical protein C3F11_02040 [Methylocystaceae bacterium]|nr:MAG: hypothetical protein C3F11_02040 [Methylocystaceae bacterium]